MITIQGTIPIQTVTGEYAGTDVKAAVKQFMSQNPNARLEMIDGNFVRGLTFCNSPVMERETGRKYNYDMKRFYCTDQDCKTCQAVAAEYDDA